MTAVEFLFHDLPETVHDTSSSVSESRPSKQPRLEVPNSAESPPLRSDKLVLRKDLPPSPPSTSRVLRTQKGSSETNTTALLASKLPIVDEPLPQSVGGEKYSGAEVVASNDISSSTASTSRCFVSKQKPSIISRMQMRSSVTRLAHNMPLSAPENSETIGEKDKQNASDTKVGGGSASEEDKDFYEISFLVGRRKMVWYSTLDCKTSFHTFLELQNDGTIEYKVRWKGWGEKDYEWVKMSDIRYVL